MKKRFDIRSFLTRDEEEAVVSAVIAAESKTAGEIRVQIVSKSQGRFSRLTPKEAVERRADREFMHLGIQQTADRTGILIMLSLNERIVAVRADKSIHEKVPDGTWTRTAELVVEGIRAGKPGEGICNAVAQVGELLAQHFPRRADDIDELPNTIAVEE